MRAQYLFCQMLDVYYRVSKLYVQIEGFHILVSCTYVQGFEYSCGSLIDNESGMLNLHPYFPWGVEQLLNLILKVGDM